MKDTLFVLRPGFDDGGTSYFCPFCAQVIGFLTYYPAVRDTLDVVELDFPRPRRRMIDLLGEANQGLPKLVLAEPPATAPADVTIHRAGERAFVTNALEIMRYLAVTRGVPVPH
jgi:hypothetical protein